MGLVLGRFDDLCVKPGGYFSTAHLLRERSLSLALRSSISGGWRRGGMNFEKILECARGS